MYTGTVIAAHGRHYLVRHENQNYQCVTRGKKSDVAVGDIVHFGKTATTQGVIESITERTTLLYRSDQYKSKLLAANVSQLFIVAATEPSFSDDLFSRALIAAHAAQVPAHIILNKIDLTELNAKAEERLHIYEQLGYPIHRVSSITNPLAHKTYLLQLLDQHTTLVIGQSGMGKSSLINLLIPDAEIAIREISTALDTGKHTTTFTRSYQINEHTHIIDSPGFQEFGLHHLTEGMLERAFLEFVPYLGQCKFYNCHHLNEPGCAILNQVQQGTILATRHALYQQLVHESAQKPLPKTKTLKK